MTMPATKGRRGCYEYLIGVAAGLCVFPGLVIVARRNGFWPYAVLGFITIGAPFILHGVAILEPVGPSRSATCPLAGRLRSWRASQNAGLDSLPDCDCGYFCRLHQQSASRQRDLVDLLRHCRLGGFAVEVHRR